MNIKKAIVSAVILYAIVFLAASGLLLTVTDETIFGSIMVVIVAVLTFFIAKDYYFKGMEVKNPVKEGLILGIVIDIIFILIEIPVMVYGFAAEKGWGHFMAWNILLGYILVLMVSILAAYKAR